MKLAIGGDHAGFEMKKGLITLLQKMNIEVQDLGPFSTDSVDYPDFAHAVAESIEKGESNLGILICGSANGVAITANKHQNIRAGLAWNKEVAELIKQHNNANIVCIPARFVSQAVAEDIATAFVNTPFEGGRHQKRVDKIKCC